MELVGEFVCAFDLTEDLKMRIEALWMGNAWAFDEREFTYEEVNASRTEEMLRVERYNAKEDIWESEWQGEVFSCRWVDARRQGGVRSRIAIRDFRGEGHSVGATNEETFAATPDASVLNIFLHLAASDSSLGFVVIDVESAFLQPR